MRAALLPISLSLTRSQVIRASNSAAMSDGYFPDNIASTSSKAARVSWWYGYARLTRRNRSALCQSSTDTAATIPCASTSSAFCTTRVGSTSPARIAATIAAISTASSRKVGTRIPRLGTPRVCPARPILCSAEATRFGDCSCITRSTDPMSIPSSSELVVIRARSDPAFRRSSRVNRRSRARDP